MDDEKRSKISRALLSVRSGQWLSDFILSLFVSCDQFQFSAFIFSSLSSTIQRNRNEYGNEKTRGKKEKSVANDEQERNNIKIDKEIRFESTYARIRVYIYV